MSRSKHGVEVQTGEGSDQTLPTDRRVDRRNFLRHMTAITAAAGVGGLGATWHASPLDAATGIRSSRPTVGEIRATRLIDMTAAETAEAIRRGDTSALEVAEACLARIDQFDELYMAFNTVNPDALRAAARAADANPGPGLLHGVPLAIKDNYYTAGVLTTANSHIFADFVPEYDAEAWARLKGQGALLVGKTQMGPLATSAATTPDGEATTRNAWAPNDRSVSPGGSSSGSATSVAAGMAASATGTQTGGSITGPSNSQGLTGLKPTMGRVSLRGIIPLTYTRDHPGPLARDARDAALMMQVMAGPDPADPRTLGLPAVPDLVTAAEPVRTGGNVRLRWPTRIGVIPGYLDGPSDTPPDAPGADASDEDRQRYERTLSFRTQQEASAASRRSMLDTYRELGAEIVEVELPEDWDTLTNGSFNNVRLPERAEPFMEVLREDVRKFGVSLSPWINGLLMPGTEYLRGQRAKLLLLRRVLDDLFAQCDVVVQTSPVPFDIIGLPEIAFPIGMTSEDGAAGHTLPVGTIFGGQPFAEDRLLSLVGAYQAVTDWHQRRPADPAVDSRGRPEQPQGPNPRIDLETVMEVCE